MTKDLRHRAAPLFLGIEGGGTRTVAILADAAGHLVKRVEAGPANLRLLSDAALVRHFRSLARKFPRPAALGIGLAGVRDERDHGRILGAASSAWPKIPCAVSHDLETALAASEHASEEKPIARVIVLSGTGSCCYGRNSGGQPAKVGGWGHLLGDKGSGYEIGLRALKAVVYYFDRDNHWPALGQRILRVLQLNEPNDLIGWAQLADKSEIAALAVEVFRAWEKRDRIANDILEGAAHILAKDAAACARRLAPAGRAVHFVLAGSVLLKSPRFARLMGRRLREVWPNALISRLELEGAWGAVVLARKNFEALNRKTGPRTKAIQIRDTGKSTSRKTAPSEDARFKALLLPQSFRSSPTEQRNPRSANLHQMPLDAAIRLMLGEERRVPTAILREEKQIERAIHLIVRALKQGGRLFYVGAGTSGRLGVLDASECPPTFRTAPEQVQGIMAGGSQALWSSVEGAEDDPVAGAQALAFRGINARDIVIGIAASGRTPFVWGALDEAKRRRAKTVLLCFNPFLKIPPGLRPDLTIAPNLGPEVLTGSTRLKAGTATKLILNLFTTLSMVQLGKIVSNLMVDLHPSNSKLRDRAVRIVQELTGADPSRARGALEESGWVVKRAWRKLASAGFSRAESPKPQSGKARWRAR